MAVDSNNCITFAADVAEAKLAADMIDQLFTERPLLDTSGMKLSSFPQWF